MSRKHNTKHQRSPSNYKKRLADRGLGRTPVMQYTGMSTTQIANAFAKLPTYKWRTEEHTDDYGRKHVIQVRNLVGGKKFTDE
jgi:hypothetical protein